MSLRQFNKIFFIGIAGSGMSAIAQYLKGSGKEVSGSDRYFVKGKTDDTRMKLEACGIICYEQDCSGITEDIDLVVVSAAIESTVPEVQKAQELNIPIMKRSELLSLIASERKTIAIGGTSGKSTTSAMLFQIMQYAGYEPGIISGAGLVSLIKEGRIGNAEVGDGKWLIIEADESDGSIVLYKPEMGVLLNIDKDHQEVDELVDIFTIFRHNTKGIFIVNSDNVFTKVLSQKSSHDFSSVHTSGAGYIAENFKQDKLSVSFTVNKVLFRLNTIGKHNMENVLAAVAAAHQNEISLEICAEALISYEGIYRRHQVLGEKEGVIVIDDYAHNPAKCAASISACQPLAPKVIAWFQPHGYTPTRFLKNEFISQIAEVLRPDDEIWMSEIFYAGGSAVKDISAKDLTDGITALGKKAIFIEDRDKFLEAVRPHLNTCVLLLMGARDPSLEGFSKKIYQNL